MISTLLIVLLVCFLMNVPIAFSLGVAAVISLMTSSMPQNAAVVPQMMVAGANSFPLLAIPFFMMAGALMEKGGVSKRIVAFADTAVGHIRGGLGAVSIVSCTIFAAISGSTPATAAAVGGLTIPEMAERGYDRPYAAANVAASSCLGVIIPPSITMVIYGTTANVSVGRLLIGGFLPGILLSICLLVVNYYSAKKHNFPAASTKTPRIEVWRSFKRAFWALLMPVIILGGIMTGVFTPTESSCIAVIYGLIIGFFVYKELKISDLLPIFYKSAINTGMIVLLIAAANPFGWLLTINQAPKIITDGLLSITSNPAVLYSLILVLFVILGTFMETTGIILLVVPILAPLMSKLGVDPVHFGVVTVCALATGMATPPVGIALFTTCSIADVSLGAISRKVWPFIIAMIVGLFILAYVPAITTLIPDLVMGKGR